MNSSQLLDQNSNDDIQSSMSCVTDMTHQQNSSCSRTNDGSSSSFCHSDAYPSHSPLQPLSHPHLLPILEPISDESSLDDSSNSKQQKIEEFRRKQQQQHTHDRNKRVKWDRIHTREYTLVVGDHPMCQDGLPVSLGWKYNDGITSPLLQPKQHLQEFPSPIQIRERQQSYTFPKRLSYEERRDRLVSVSNLTLDEIKNDEIDLVVRTLQESWQSHSIINDETATANNDDPMNIDEMNEDNLILGHDPLADTTLDADDMMIMTGILDTMNNDDLLDGDLSNFEWTDDDDDDENKES